MRVFPLVLLCAAALSAQARTWHVAQTHAAAADAGPGTAEQPFRSLAPAAEQAQPGDTILVGAGVYRERVMPARGGEEGAPIVYQAAPGERVVVRGSDRLTADWTTTDTPGVWRAPLDGIPGDAFRTAVRIAASAKAEAARPVDAEPLPRVLGQVFVDGRPYTQVESAAALARTAATWLVSADGTALLVHFPAGPPPRERAVEVSVRERLFAPRLRGLRHIHVRGFVFEHAANPGPFPQRGAVATRSGQHWVIEDNVIRHAATVGLDIGSETWKPEDLTDLADESQRRIMIGGHHLVRGNTICDNGLAGIAGWNTQALVIVGNVIERNHTLGYRGAEADWAERGGIKLHGANDAVIEGNLVRHNGAFGIWIDNGQNNTRVTRNLVHGNQEVGIFFEVDNRPALIDSNVVAENAGYGIYAHDASALTIAHNLVLDNSHYGVWLHYVSDRTIRDELSAASNHRVLNNLILGNGIGAVSLPIDSERATGNVSDGNLFNGPDNWGLGLGNPRFRISNLNGRINAAKMAERLLSAMDAAGLPADERPTAAELARHPDLTLAQWQAAGGYDANSAVARDLRLALRPLTQVLQVSLKGELPSPATQRVEGVERDWYGNPLPEHPFPGPFQVPLTDGAVLELYPVVEGSAAP